ncbi:MAG: peptide chain release factor N(5)-glutamine methyltransferase [Planctomycetes bacterium]|nr:peptide chain release factor N(5)-glutamine methyltransferase [Planctomycetota bacterium]
MRPCVESSSGVSTMGRSELGELHHRTCLRLREAGVEESAREAYLLLCEAAKCSLSRLLTRQDGEWTEFDRMRLEDLLRRREGREPWAYIKGSREFYGRNFRVGPGVLIPRPETEILIEWLREEQETRRCGRALDLCCGSGNIAITLALEFAIAVRGTDISPAALRYARANGDDLGAGALCHFERMDLLAETPSLEGVGLITINPPYIPEGDLAGLEPEVERWEPHEALNGGGEEGLEFFLRVRGRLRPARGVPLYAELGVGQGVLLSGESVMQGWQLEGSRRDLAGIERIFKFVYRGI